MKYRYIFLLGRPGCGKSALYRELGKRIRESDQAATFERLDDFPKLWAKLQADDALEQEAKERLYSTRADSGDLLITNDNLYTEILQELGLDALKIDKPNHVVFLEFARPNYTEAFQYFDKRILDRCVVIYVEVGFEICWARIVARHEASIDEGGDDHWICREEMERVYLHDDQDTLVRYMKDQNIPVSVVNNETEGEEHLSRQVEELYNAVF